MSKKSRYARFTVEVEDAQGIVRKRFFMSERRALSYYERVRKKSLETKQVRIYDRGKTSIQTSMRL